MDEFPSSSGSGGMTGAPPSEEDFSKMPIQDRLASKIWKARLSAYTELSSLFSRSSSEQDPIFKTYTRNPDLLKSMVLDANAVAQEKATECLKAFVEFGGKAAGKTREVVLPSIVDKCLGSTRAGTKKNALEIVLLYVEMEDVMASEGPVEDVCAGLKAKQPKLVASCVTALKDLIKAFGPKQVSPKPILKVLPTIFAHSDKTVRAEGSLLAQELHRYIGAALEPTIDTLKDIQAKELRSQFEEFDKKGEGKPIPERYILSEKIKAEEAAAAAAAAASGGDSAEGGGDEAAEEEGDVDAFDLADPIDPFKHKEFPANFDEALASKKWKDRTDALEALLKALNSSPKLLMNNGYDSVIDQLTTKIAKDSNINVVLECCRCIESMAKGLRSNFSKYKEKVLPPILEKLKEKKASTVEILAQTLDSVFQTVTFSDVLEDIFAATKHKNPNVKTEAIKFLVRCLRTTRTPPSKADIKPIGDTLVNALSDANADVRDAGIQGLGTLMKLVGERMMNQFMEGLDDIKKGKIMDEFKVATVKAKMGGPTPSAASSSSAPAAKKPTLSSSAKPKAAAPSASAPRKPLLGDKENESPAPKAAPAPVAKPPARLMAKKPASTASSSTVKKPAAASASSSKPAGKAAAAATEPVKYRFSSEDAEAKAAELIPSNISTQIASGVWKDRLNGMTELLTWLQGEVESIESEVVLRSLAKKPGWKESNFQVLSEVYKVLQLLAEQCPTFGRSSIALSVQPLCDKLGDIKLKGPAGETLNIYAEKTSFGFVLAQALGPLASLKAPKAIADSLLWVDQSLLDFGTTGVDMRGLIDHLITCLKSANAGVRTNATKVIGTISRFIGPAINTFLGDLNSQLKTSVEAEIDKASSQSRPEPTKFGAEHKVSSGGGSKGGNGGGASAAAAEEDDLDALIPRVDLDKLVTPSIITRLGDANWKERKEALEELQGILEANQRLKSNMTDLVTPLKLRYADSNVAVRSLALDVIARIATAMNKGFEQHARTFVPPVAQVLADAKAPIRASASAALTAIAEQVEAGPMIPGFAHQLDAKSANPMLRQELYTWMGDWFSNHHPEKPMDLAPLAPSAVLCLDDKLAAVRKAAQAVLPYIILRAGFKFVSEQTGQLKAASRTSVTPLIDAARVQAQAMAPSKAAPAPAASKAPAVVKKPAVVAAAAAADSSGGSSSPPATSSPPRASAISRPASKQPIASAAMRSLKAPGTRPISRIDSDDLDSRGLPAPGFKSKLGGLKKPGMAISSSNAASSASSPSDRTPPFLSGDGKGKALRERKEPRGQHWISSEGTARPELMETLRAQAEPHLSQSLSDSMFSKDHNAERDYLSALGLLTNFIGTPSFPEEEYGLTPTDAVARIVANSDLVFKYIAIRLTDNNTSITIKCLDVLDHLVELLRSDQYHMNDYEANSILPCLVAKFGDAKTQFRDRIREIFRHITFIFPPSKLLTYYVDCGLPSKNARTRTECLSELGYLFARNGLQVCTPAKTLPIIGKQIADRDTNVRTAALLTLGEAYKIVGEDVWKLVGPLPAKDKSLLEERLKRTTTGGSSSTTPALGRASSIARPGSSFSPPTGAKSSAASSSSPTGGKIPSRLARPSSMLGSGLQPPKSRIAGPSGLRAPTARASEIAEPEHEEPATNGNGNGHGHENNDQTGYDDDEEGLAEQSQSFKDESDDLAVEQSINEILSSDWDRSINAIKELRLDIEEKVSSLARHADRLAIATSKQLKKAFPDSEPNTTESFRLKKHILLLLVSMFDTKPNFDDRTLASYMSRSGLVPILTGLLQCLILVSDRSEDPNSPSYSKQINAILLKSFGSTNLNTLFAASLSIVMEATEDLPELEGQLLDKRAKFAELMIKCQWKFVKRLPNAFKDNYIDAPQLLLDIENFLQVIPPQEWRRRYADGIKLGNLPFKTVKKFIEDIASFYGEESLSMLELIENPDKAIVYTYLYRALNQETPAAAADPELAQTPEVAPGTIEDRHSGPITKAVAGRTSSAARKEPPAKVAPPVTSPPLPTSPPTSSSSSGDADTSNAELNSIFQRISHKEESRPAIKDLYEFQKKYPHKKDTAVARALAETGPIFQRYIKRALANLEREDPDAAPAPEDDKRSSTTSSVRDSKILESARSSIMNGDVPSSPSARQSMILNGEGPGSPSGSRIRNSVNDERLAALKAKFGSPQSPSS